MAEEEAKVEGEEREPEREGDSEEVEVKFRLFDGSDIGPLRCNAAATTIAALKDRVVAEWPKGRHEIPFLLIDEGRNPPEFWSAGPASCHGSLDASCNSCLCDTYC